jgi:hypothetical protein
MGTDAAERVLLVSSIAALDKDGFREDAIVGEDVLDTAVVARCELFVFDLGDQSFLGCFCLLMINP